MNTNKFPFDTKYRSFLFRIPGRDHLTEITHKTWDEMNHLERRAVAADKANAHIRAKAEEIVE